MKTNTAGIFQSDIILRTAIQLGLEDLRANPDLLDYVFASLPQDDLTAQAYGQAEIDRAKEWFLKTNIPVFMNTRFDGATLPAIVIELSSSTESENTLGDIHYDTKEDYDLWPTIAKFNPISYDPKTGTIVAPDGLAIVTPLFPNMIVLDAAGREYPIQTVLSNTSFTIQSNVVGDFSTIVLKPLKPAYTADLESAWFSEQYTIGCFAPSEPVYITYLHSIVTFILLRYRQALLEARGFERSSFTSTDLIHNDLFDPETVYSRHIKLSGYVRQYWPKAIKPKIMGISFDGDAGFRIMGAGHVPPDLKPDDLLWIGDQDSLQPLKSLATTTDIATSTDVKDKS